MFQILQDAMALSDTELSFYKSIRIKKHVGCFRLLFCRHVLTPNVSWNFEKFNMFKFKEERFSNEEYLF